VNELPNPAESDAAAAVNTPSAPAEAAASRAWWVAALLLLVGMLGALALAWQAEQRVASLELELVRRQQESTVQATEASVLAKQAQETAR
jgi:uroporphyrin-III C-methyltransferase